MTPCRICQSIDLADVSAKPIQEVFDFAETYPLNHNLFQYSTQYDGFQHPVYGLVLYHRDLDSLWASAIFCELCSLVSHQINVYLRNGEAAAKVGLIYPESFELWICGTSVCGFFQVLGYNKASAEKRFVKSAAYELLAGFGICVDDASVLRTVTQGRKVALSARSPVLLRQIKEWMNATTAIHISFSHVPTRLLRIEDNGERLQLSSSSIHKEYACLSHCWGLNKPLMLNSHTSEKLWKGINTIELPRSFQDAIWLTHQLGIYHLWIDSLCIRQDDVEDWARECTHMDKIYQNATIVIAATQANDSSEGFLDKKLQRTYTPAHISVGGIHGQVLLYPVPLKFIGDATRLVELDDEPLTARGWALQERYMARRTIHFTRDQVLFEGEGRLFAEDSGFTIALPTRSPFTLSESSKGSPAWTQVVERYSRRKLMLEQDKLPALAALATYFSSISELGTSNQEKQYLAGLWSTDLVKHLCWRVPYGHSPGRRPMAYRAPTWSWVSIDGPVVFLEKFSKSLTLIRDTHVELKRPGDFFGEVTSGWLFLNAIRLTPKTVSANGHYLEFSENGTAFCIDAGWDTEQDHTKEQVQHLIIHGKVTVVPVAWQETLEPLAFAGPVCLILMPLEQKVHPYDSTPTYKRVGLGIARSAQRNTLMKLITETWTNSFLSGDLVNIILV